MKTQNIDYSRFITSSSCHQCEIGNHEACLEKRERLNGILTSYRFHCFCFGSNPTLHVCKVEEITTNNKKSIKVSKIG